MKRIKTPGSLINGLLGCVGGFALILSAGCATPTSSDDQSGGEMHGAITVTNRSVFATGRLLHKRVHRPAANSHLQLSQSRQIPDVLVEYGTQGSTRFQRRACWLFENNPI